MPTITFLLPDGSDKAVEARNGLSLMETALENSIPGIIAECNGSAACATCHVVLSDTAMALVSPISEHENDMLDFATSSREPGSRLSCQIKITDVLDNILVRVPAP